MRARQALRHLMQEGSPIEDLFTVCHECETMHATLRAAMLAAHEARAPRRGPPCYGIMQPQRGRSLLLLMLKKKK
jgi:hypothetical protein